MMMTILHFSITFSTDSETVSFAYLSSSQKTATPASDLRELYRCETKGHGWIWEEDMDGFDESF
jgi:hypothetical protein